MRPCPLVGCHKNDSPEHLENNTMHLYKRHIFTHYSAINYGNVPAIVVNAFALALENGDIALTALELAAKYEFI